MTQSGAGAVSFQGLEVAAFESRRAKEMAALISSYGGVPRVGPSMREVPLEENTAAFAFAERLFAGEIDAVIFMTGVGTRTLFEALETRYPRAQIVAALARVTTVARGPKPVSVLREAGVTVTITVPEPNTWREILQELDEHPRGLPVEGSRIAVQEYGIPNEAFLQELRDRGARVVQVPVYRWALPDDLGPLLEVVQAVADARARIALFTNAVQVEHVLRVAGEKGLKDRLLAALRAGVVCSVGPTCSEALVGRGIAVDLEPEHPKMGSLVRDAAARAPGLLQKKGAGNGPVGVAVIEPAEEVQGGIAAEPWRDSRLMKACRREPVDATPIWLMRQAGRYMKEYRELRSKVPFLELCKNADLAAELTVTAAERLGVDAAIIFADLLLILEPLGFELEYDKGEGPVVQPVLREPRDVDRVQEVEPASLSYLGEAIRKTRAQLDPRLPLIGFGAAPFTLASYLIEGGASKSFRHTKTLMYRDPGAWRALMERLASSLARYINGQIHAGVQAVQIFDTWVGCLSPDDYREFVQPYSRALIRAIAPGTPVIHFGTGTAAFLEEMRDAGGEIIGLDAHVDLGQAWARLGDRVGIQGNLDPAVLFGELGYIQSRVERILAQAGSRSGHIFNLGHGVLPDTPYLNVLALIEMVHELSAR